MKHPFILPVRLFLLFYFNQAISQPLTGIVTYKYTFNLDSSPGAGNTLSKTGLLFFDGTTSVFKYNYPEIENTQTIQDSSIINIIVDSIGDIIFKDPADKRIISRIQVWGTPYITEEPLPEINWVIGTDKKKTGGYTCQKATTRFRGRDYEVWFTQEIPVDSGPWKFHGLPGLILEARDNKHEIEYSFVAVVMPAIVKEQLLPPTAGIKIDFETYKTIWQKETAQLKEFLISHAVNGVQADIKTNVSPIEKTYD